MPEQLPFLRIAYEPVWLICEKGVPVSSHYVAKVHDFIRQLLIELLGSKANSIPILYGGSVNQENFTELAVLTNVNGLFIGRSAWDIDYFDTILKQLSMSFLK